jgi:hypothetical protein
MPDLGDRQLLVFILPDKDQPNHLFIALFLHRLLADMRDHLDTQGLKLQAEMAAGANRLLYARPQGAVAVHSYPWSPSLSNRLPLP